MMIDNSANKRSSKWTLSVILILLGCFLLFELHGLIIAFLGAIIFYILFRPAMKYLCEKKHWKRGLAAGVVLLISFLIILLPIFLVSYMIIPKVSLFFNDTSIVMQMLKNVEERIRIATGVRIFSEQNMDSLQQKVTGFIAGFFGASVGIITSIAIMYVMLFYLLKNYGAPEEAIEGYLPFDKGNIKKFSHELEAQTFSNALAMPLYALLQAVLATLGYWAFGLDEPVFWGVMTGFFSFIPVVGTFMIWLPAAVFLYSAGFVGQGIGLGLFGLIILSTVNNLFLFAFQRKFANVHPVVSLLGFILGVSLFGIPGIIFGPLLISYFLILLKIYKEEFIDVT